MPYAKVILPLAAPGSYSYEIPAELVSKVKVGIRVEVQFGPKRVYSALIAAIVEEDPSGSASKSILNVLDEEPLLGKKHLDFWHWMADYYMCLPGEIMIAALPTAFRLSSETKVLLNPSFNQDFSLLNDQEYLIAEALSIQEELSIADVKAILQINNVNHIIRSLLEKNVLSVKEELKGRYKPKMASFIRLADAFMEEEAQRTLFDELNRAPKQLAILLSYFHFSRQPGQEVEKSKVMKKAEATSGIFKSLVKKGIFVESKQVVDRIKQEQAEDTINYELTELQQNALEKIKQHHAKNKIVLLHGVTSSGKTQLYMELIQEQIAAGHQVLYLLPEIALTAQMIGRLKKVFGSEVGVYHSKFNSQERVEIWHKIRRGEYKIVIGARSAVFLPFQDLGLVIVDEEHDPSYKQQDPAPRYNGRDAVIYLAHQMKAKLVLGSATPSFESYQNAIKGKYGLVEMHERFGGVQAPEIVTVDIKEARRQKQMKTMFAPALIDAIQEALDAKEQVIIFQNRRGYAPYMVCQVCAYVPQCVQCDVSLTYHKYINELKCHYCGYRKRIPATCKECGSEEIQIQGYGTEKIQEELNALFPDHQAGRLDLETARGKNKHAEIIGQFESQKLDMLVGTQMVTKGLDFDNVSLVGIVNADMSINYPDFRAGERAFQLLLQVSGRAGRRKKQGKVLIQTSDPNQAVIDHVLRADYNGYFQLEMWERQQFLYPPYHRIIRLTLKDRNKNKINDAAFKLKEVLMDDLGPRVLGPAVPSVSWVRNYYLREIIIKMGKGAQENLAVKNSIRSNARKLKGDSRYKSVFVSVDVDPY